MYKLMSMAKAVLRQWLIPPARKKLSSLAVSPDPDLANLSKAILDALNGKFDNNELEWIDKIESVRKELQHDGSVIAITDFGAGKPDDDRTEEEMLKGINVNLTVSEVSKASKPQFWASILFKLVRYFEPRNSLELGTCVGISGAYQAAAQVLNATANSRLITLEGSESTSNLARNNFKRLGLSHINVVTGKFYNTLDKVLDTNEKFDYVFIDGHHDEQATLKYFDEIIPRLSTKALVIFDDISWSEGMKRAWSTITSNKNVSISIDLRTIGICLLRPNGRERVACKVSLI